MLTEKVSILSSSRQAKYIPPSDFNFMHYNTCNINATPLLIKSHEHRHTIIQIIIALIFTKPPNVSHSPDNPQSNDCPAAIKLNKIGRDYSERGAPTRIRTHSAYPPPTSRGKRTSRGRGVRLHATICARGTRVVDNRAKSRRSCRRAARELCEREKKKRARDKRGETYRGLVVGLLSRDF